MSACYLGPEADVIWGPRPNSQLTHSRVGASFLNWLWVISWELCVMLSHPLPSVRRSEVATWPQAPDGLCRVTIEG